MNKKCCANGKLNLPDEVDGSLRECGGLEGLRSSLSPDDLREKIAQRHAALSDPKRLMLLESLQYFASATTGGKVGAIIGHGNRVLLQLWGRS